MRKKKPPFECWVCGPVKGRVRHPHHVMLKKVDEELTVDLCPGCHWLVGLLARRKFLNEEKRVADLITLARFQAALIDAATVVKYIRRA